MYIKLTNSSKRTADLYLVSLTQTKPNKTVIETEAGFVEPERKPVLGRKPGWSKGMTPEAISEALVKGDPEIDAAIGRPVLVRSSVFLDKQGVPVTNFRILEDKFLPDGTLKETKPYKASEPNIELPLQIAAKGGQVPDEMVQRFVIHKVYQMAHTDNLSFDFMFKLCQEIESQGYVRIAAGLKGNEPLVLRREGLPCFAFLRGKVEGQTYVCTLHLTHTELKLPAAPVAAPVAGKG
jgi:hypothetical protein